MNNKALTLSIFMGIVALFFVNSYVESVEEEAKKKYGAAVLVVVAKNDIKEMDTVLETMLTFKEVPKTFLEPASISLASKSEDAAKAEKEKVRTLRELVGSVASVPIKKGEQITFNKISEIGIRTGLAPQIAPGRRALSILVNETTGVAKLVKPGDRVDLIAVLDFGGGKENKIAKTFLQDVVVLAVGRNVTNNPSRIIEGDSYGKDKVRSLAEDFSFASVTLEVDPVQAQVLALISSSGDSPVTLALRNNEDTERSNFGASVLSEVLGPDVSKIKIGQGGNQAGRR